MDLFHRYEGVIFMLSVLLAIYRGYVYQVVVGLNCDVTRTEYFVYFVGRVSSVYYK